MKELNCYELQTNCWPQGHQSSPPPDVVGPTLALFTILKNKNTKDHSAVSRYSIAISSILIVENSNYMWKHQFPFLLINVPWKKSELSFLKLLFCIFCFLRFLFLVKYIKSCFKKNYWHSQKKNQHQKHDKSSRLFSS